MAWDVKYSIEFSDIHFIDWRVEIQEDGSFTEVPIQAMSQPAVIEWFGQDDIFEQNIMGSQLSLNIESPTNFEYDEFFTSDNFQYKVLVYHGVTLFWSGYIQIHNFQEPYDAPPYTVTLTATDGLGLLKDFKFKDLGYTVRQVTSVVIHDILDLVGITEFTEYVNLYESTMGSDTDDSMFDQSGIDPYLYEEQTCYDALSSILFSLNAGIRQGKGVFEIVRYKELRDTTMYGRTFTNGTTIGSTPTKTPEQILNRPGDKSNLWDYEGGTKMDIPQVKILNVNLDYGFKESILLNYNFEKATFSAGAFEYWTSGDGADVDPECTVNPGVDTGIVINDVSSTLVHTVQQTVDVVATTDKMIMQFDIGYWGTAASADFYAYVWNQDTGANFKYMQANASWGNSDAEFFLGTITGSGSFKTNYLHVSGITYTGTIGCLVYNAESASDARAIFRNLKFYFTTADGTTPKGVGYSMDNALNGQIIDKEYILGDGYGFDNDPSIYKGAFNVWSGSDPLNTSLNWHTRGFTENCPVIQLIGEELLAQYARQGQMIDLPVREMDAATYLDINGNIQDSYNQVANVNRIFGVSRALYNIIDREWQLTLTEIL
jgi:hypothetical protein